MTTSTEIAAEVERNIESAIAANGVANPKWVTQAVLSAHPDINGSDADWHRFCASSHVRSVVQKTVQRYKTKEEDPDPQLVLPGYERLQVAYLVSRDNEQVIVRIDLLTDTEIVAKCAELMHMAKGCMKHADELERYREERAQQSKPTG